MATQTWTALVIEDEHDSVQMVSRILAHYGVEVRLASNGLEALEILREFEPSIVVTDLAMPEMDGWSTLAEMRANPATAHIPVVAITAYHSANVAEDAMQAGFNAFFPKPFDPQEFFEGLARVVNGQP